MINDFIPLQEPEYWDDDGEAKPEDTAINAGRFSPDELAATRAEILSSHAEANLLDRPRLAMVFLRLALMTDLLDRLWIESPRIASELARFCDESLQTLGPDLAEEDEEKQIQRILSTIGERWGEHLHLLDEDDTPEEGQPLNLQEASAGPKIIAMKPGPRPSETAGAGDGPRPEKVVNPAVSTQAILKAKSPSSKDHPNHWDLESFLSRQVDREQPRRGELDAAEPEFNAFDIPDAPRRVAIDPEFAETFLDEAGDLFERVQGLVLTLIPGKDARQSLLELGRCLHTLKGAAGSVGLDEFAGLIHSAEETIESASLRGVADSRLIDLMHKLLRYMEGLFPLIRSGQSVSPTPEPRVDHAPQSEGVHETVAPAVEAEPQLVEGPVRISSERLDELLDLVSELITRRGHWAAQSETLKEFSTLARTSRNRLLATVDRIQDLRPTQSLPRISRDFQGRQSDLPELSRRLAEQADDLVVLTDGAQAFTRPLAETSEALAGLTLKIWESLQALRIVPVKGLFQRLARVAHDAARVEGRMIELTMIGEDIGLDRALQDKAFEPMLHIVRNAVAHGIESAAERRKAGKPETGVVHFSAARAGNTMVLSVSDDGKGLDYRAIERKGRLLGLIPFDEAPDIERLNNLIFQPGFSTKDEANAISGRGVGMDVVTQEVAKIHGSVVLNSVPGEGTRVSLHLPARLSLEQTMLVRVDGQVFSLPVELIEGVESLHRDTLESRDAGTWFISGETRARLVSARDALGIESASEPSCPKILLVRVEGKPLAVVVDSIDGTRELVIKPLGPLVAGHPMISGTSQLVTGEVVLALNPSGLAHWAQREGLVRRPSLASRRSDQTQGAILVVDDSISVRKIVARQLRAMGHRVDEASDGLDALGKLRENRYAMVLTDLDMPRMDGFELLSELAAHESFRAIPVGVTSTRSDDRTLERVAQLGARGFIPKPIDADELNLAITKWIGESAKQAGPTPSTPGEPVPSSLDDVFKTPPVTPDRGSPCNPL